jgi:hypothetical protein
VIFPDINLARRLEFHEAQSSVEHARLQARLYPWTRAVSQPFAGGQAVFCGRKNPLTQVVGLGLSGQVDPNDLEAIEAFYRARDQKMRIRVCPLAHASLRTLLNQRGYCVEDFLNVYVHELKTIQAPPAVPGLKISLATTEEARSWFKCVGAEGDWTEPDGIAFLLIRSTLSPGTRLFLAWRDGQIVGSGAITIRDGMAALMAGETLPIFRNEGIHTALLHARLKAAVEAGCDLAMIDASPGGASTGNILRAGFQLAYTSVSVLKRLV